METSLNPNLANGLDFDNTQLKLWARRLALTFLFVTALLTFGMLFTLLIMLVAIPAGFLTAYYLTITTFKQNFN